MGMHRETPSRSRPAFDASRAPPRGPAQGGDEPLDAFAREHQAELLAFFQRRVPSRPDAADLAQESWTRLLRYRRESSPRALRMLLFSIARNLLSNHWRRGRLHGVEQPTDFTGLDLPSEIAGPARQADARQSLLRLEAAVAALPPKCRAVFLLSRIEGLANAEIAGRCGISVKMVEKHLARAIVQCRAGVEEPGP